MNSFDGIIEFVAVAESHGFSSAAKQLGCSTSHVSRQVSRLEERLGVALLARSTRQVNLTDAGQLYYQQCRGLVNGLQQASESLNTQQITLSGTLRVSAAGAFAEEHVAPALMEFAKSYPDLTIEMDFNSRMVNFIEDGIDFAIRYGALKDSGLVARKLVDRPMAAVASQDYLTRYGEPTHPSQLKQHSCIIANNDHWIFEKEDNTINTRVHGRWKSNNSNAVISACEEGLGIAYMPKSSLAKGLDSGSLVPILQDFWGKGNSSWIVYQNQRFLPVRARLAIDYLINYFSDWDSLHK
ncbi:LysR family transcriptional regulator [Photobacterium angustum]|uniref:LysR family transcriptional regulator n=1 Tax=Photobacterium angustum TaxID=661 RepID=UPI0005E7808E|nr:LysR family transcriptional regulator [Photobacterium angustum]KJG15179.1 LysR family transcriptional regulator [Photobacterium angustum]KJG19967.1 LysR family transcriptional regulator [Photobacterium angustum]KJG27123.1 LysR family transcriptional regulator [Photobacterium angustum]PSW94010.1 LysR family transcriptional regulator [Photobacterium angustum]PSW99013.1 LysR family transcriptional regulator [Photobacterium angustum]